MLDRRLMICAVILLPLVCQAQPAGIYIYAGATVPGPTTMSAPNFNGMTAVLKWNQVEAVRGVYDWAILDNFVAKAQQYGKELIIGYRHGCISGCGASHDVVPAWYSAEGLPSFACDNGEVGPATWTPEFQGPWRELIRATILRYRDEPEVVGFIFSGVGSWRYAEMAPNVVCNTAATQNDRTRAVAQGYTKQKLQDAALLLAGDMTRLTPKAIRFAFARTIDESTGQASIQTTHDWVIRPLHSCTNAAMTYTLSSLSPLRGDPLGQWNQQPLQPFEAELNGLRPHVAWQTDTPANGGPDTGAEMWATVRIGWNYGMRFLEVQNVDVVNPDMQAPLACANQAMLTGDGSCLQ